MGEALLVEGDTLQCAHGGMHRLQSGNAAMKAGGKSVVTFTMEVGLSFAPGAPGVTVPCTHQISGNPSPCTATLPATSGLSLNTKVGGQPALLTNASGQTVNVPPATWSVAQSSQTKATSK